MCECIRVTFKKKIDLNIYLPFQLYTSALPFTNVVERFPQFTCSNTKQCSLKPKKKKKTTTNKQTRGIAEEKTTKSDPIYRSLLVTCWLTIF